MEQSPALAAARHFLSLVWDGEPPGDAALLAALDRLLAAYHDTPDALPSGADEDAPREDFQSLYNQLGPRFPDYGYYPIADPGADFEEPHSLGDAIDDLADLIRDLREVLWRADHVGLDDAHWHFRLHFFHWGRHARELSLYLHDRLW